MIITISKCFTHNSGEGVKIYDFSLYTPADQTFSIQFMLIGAGIYVTFHLNNTILNTHWLNNTKSVSYCRGQSVVVVGEWQGDTGTQEFTALLQQNFHLVKRVALPNWSDTAHEMTRWSRKTVAEAKKVLGPGRSLLGEFDNTLERVSVSLQLQLVNPFFNSSLLDSI